MNTSGRIYTYWSGDSISDYIKQSIEHNVKINDSEVDSTAFILCYDKKHVPIVGWNDFIRRLEKYSNFHLQEIDGKDVFDNKKEFLPDQYKSLFHIIQNYTEDAFLTKGKKQAYKKDFIAIYVLQNKNTAWLDGDVVCHKPISFKNMKYGYMQAFGHHNIAAAAIIISDNNYISSTYAKLALDIVQLLNKAYNAQEIGNNVGYQHIFFKLADYLNILAFRSNIAVIMSDKSNQTLESMLPILKNHLIYSEDIHVPPSGNRNNLDQAPSMNFSMKYKGFDPNHWKDRSDYYDNPKPLFFQTMELLPITRGIMDRIKQNKSSSRYFSVKNNINKDDKHEYFIKSTYLREIIYRLFEVDVIPLAAVQSILSSQPEYVMENIGMKLSEVLEIAKEKDQNTKKGIFNNEHGLSKKKDTYTTLNNISVEERHISSGKGVK